MQSSTFKITPHGEKTSALPETKYPPSTKHPHIPPTSPPSPYPYNSILSNGPTESCKPNTKQRWLVGKKRGGVIFFTSHPSASTIDQRGKTKIIQEIRQQLLIVIHTRTCNLNLQHSESEQNNSAVLHGNKRSTGANHSKFRSSPNCSNPFHAKSRRNFTPSTDNFWCKWKQIFAATIGGTILRRRKYNFTRFALNQPGCACGEKLEASAV